MPMQSPTASASSSATGMGGEGQSSSRDGTEEKAPADDRGGRGNPKVSGDDPETRERVVEIWNCTYHRQIIVPVPEGPAVFCIDQKNDHQDFMGTFPNLTDKFVVEQTGDWVGTPFYSLRVKGTDRYLTVEMYGEEQRKALGEVLPDAIPQLLPELIPNILDYIVQPDTVDHEGPGYLINPISALPGPPDAQQVFRLCDEDEWGVPIETGDVGFMPFWGQSYLRCLPWSNIVTQSPICQNDEQWALIEDETEEE